jgi:hypothetical protein
LLFSSVLGHARPEARSVQTIGGRHRKSSSPLCFKCNKKVHSPSYENTASTGSLKKAKKQKSKKATKQKSNGKNSMLLKKS